MQNTTRRRLAAAALSTILLGCDRADTPAPSGGPGTTTAEPATPAGPGATTEPGRWEAEPLEAPGFRAFGWGTADTLWGIVRGRPGWLARDGSHARLDAAAWDVQAAPGLVSWTNEDGLWLRRGARPQNIMPVQSGPGADYTGPDLLWSPRGTRALLTWTGEGGVVNAVLEGDSVRRLAMSQPGIGGASRATWLDEERVVVRVVAFAPRSGPSEYREGGYRADLAVLDVAHDRLRVITDAADGEFYSPEGVLEGDALLAGITRAGAVPGRHVRLHVPSGQASELDLPPGRAAAAHGVIAILRPVATPDDPEPAWQLDLMAGDSVTADIVAVQGHAVRLIWHPEHRVLAVAQESERAGMRTWIVSRK